MCMDSKLIRIGRDVRTYNSLKAYRVFVRNRKLELKSVYHGQKRAAYVPGTWEVTRDNPNRSGDFGFHGFKDLKDARRVQRTAYRGHRKETWEVRFAGIVAEHETGYRATMMKLVKRIYRRVGVRNVHAR